MPIGDDKFSELPHTVNELVADRAIRHALYLERYKTHLVNEILAEFNNRLEPALRERIEKSLQRVTVTNKQLRALFKHNGELVKAEYEVMEAKLYDQLRDVGQVESSWLIRTLQQTTPIACDVVSPNPNMLKALVIKQPMEGALVKDWFAKLSKDTAFAVNRHIQMGMIEGEGIEKIVRRIKGTRKAHYKDGILNARRNHLRAVVRTSVSHVSHGAREEVYKANTDVVKAVQIQATLDTRTCLECMNLDGKVFKVGDGRRPPFHYGCRCTDTPVLKSWKELDIKGLKEVPDSTRASMNGRVAATMTYAQWLRKQAVDVQNEALGKTRATLFRQGRLKLKQFIGRHNKPITLKALAKTLNEGV